mmetsp:Transcript_28446/g.90631  ORF Transcript_28446/g.90631 Transcript_28446/m.90631 type:complete len:209 (-) Transcript_28446:1416-2042(-)
MLQAGRCPQQASSRHGAPKHSTLAAAAAGRLRQRNWRPGCARATTQGQGRELRRPQGFLNLRAPPLASQPGCCPLGVTHAVVHTRDVATGICRSGAARLCGRPSLATCLPARPPWGKLGGLDLWPLRGLRCGRPRLEGRPRGWRSGGRWRAGNEDDRGRRRCRVAWPAASCRGARRCWRLRHRPAHTADGCGRPRRPAGRPAARCLGC